MSKGNKQVVEKSAPPPLEDDEEDTFASHFAELPSVIQRRVMALKKLHKEHLSLEKKYREEVLLLERKYQDLYAPLFQKRATVVSGEHEPTDEETRVEGEEVIKADDKDKAIKGVPEFWLTVMKTNAIVGDSITEADEEALKFLRDIRYTRLEGDKHGFQLSFHFAENAFFTNTVLTKTYHLVDDDNLFGELVFDRAEGCDIKWKPNKNLTVKIVKKTQKARPNKGGKRGGGNAGAGRVVTVEEPCDSFFSFFAPPVPPSADDEEDAEDGLIDDMLEADFETGVIFKDKLIPHAALWFTGEALEFEDDYGDDSLDYEFGDEDDEDDEDEDEDEDEEEEEEERPKKGGRGGPPAKKGGAPFQPPTKGGPNQPQQPECKQQ